MIHEYTMIFRWLSPFDPKLSMGSLPTPEALAKSELIERDALVCIEYPREIGAAGTKVGGGYPKSPWGHRFLRSTWRIWGSPRPWAPPFFCNQLNPRHRDIENIYHINIGYDIT